MDRRKTLQEVEERVRASVGMGETDNFLQMVSLLIEVGKDKLVTCEPHEVAHLQGEVRGYIRLLERAKRRSIDQITKMGKETV